MAKTTQQDLMENPYVTNAILECVLSISKNYDFYYLMEAYYLAIAIIRESFYL